VLRVTAYAAGTHDLAAVARDVGRTDAVRARAPDVDIRFVHDLSPARLRILDGGSVGYGDDGIYFLDPSTQMPLAFVSQGERWGEAQILCVHGQRRVPFLAASLDLAALSHQWAPVHGSGWVTADGKGVLVTGWAHSGKTGALISACQRGASPVGDDRILVSRSGASMIGTGRPIGVKDWHMVQLRLPAIGARPVRRGLARVTWALNAMQSRAPRARSVIPSKGLAWFRRRLEVELPLDRLSVPAIDVGIDVLIILETHRNRSFVAERTDATSATQRVAAQTDGELLPALRAQLAFKYALPGGGWQGVGRAPEVALDILEDALRTVPAYLVRHPYPCSLKELDSVIARIVAEV